MRLFRRLPILILVCALVLQAFPHPALAEPLALEGVAVHDVIQEDLDANGAPDRTTIYCSFATESDAVQVYDGAGDMPASTEWQQATDFENDTWVFDVAADGNADLIIVFAVEGNQHVAYLYDDRSGDGHVAYAVDGAEVVIEETDFWAVRVIADGPWYNADGSINRSVLVSVDGQFAMPGFDSDLALNVVSNDGTVDMEVETRVGASAEWPAYTLARSFSPVRAHLGRTVMRVNVPDSILPEIKGYVFWPHLGPGLYAAQEPWELRPLLRMAWSSARFDRNYAVNNLLQPIPPEAGWRVFATVPLVKGTVNFLDFENPFAYYDLAADRDAYPELTIRIEYAGANVPYFLDGRFNQPIEGIRYSWDQDNDRFWDFSVNLIGRHDITDIVTFPDFAVRTIRYSEYPDWVVERAWDTGAFVAVESGRYSSSEGIYEGWVRAWRDTYVTGLVDEPSLERVQDIRAGMRLDYTPNFGQQPRLYFSPVDRKLHLLGAEAGVWNLDDVQRVRYGDEDGDGYLDRWAFTVRPDAEDAREETVKSLQIAGGVLLYGDEERVRLVRSSVAPSLFETLPPRDHAEWLALGQQLEEHGRDFAADDFLGMMAQFAGEATDIQGASLDGFRLTDDGFRFVLRLQPNYRVLADGAEVGAAGLDAGSYVVAYDGAFQVRPATPPRVALSAGAIACDADLHEKAWTTVTVTLRNTGLVDVAALPVRVLALPEGEEEPQTLAEETVFIPGEGEVVLTSRWWPALSGRWTIWVEADAEEAAPSEVELGEMAPLDVDVAAAQMPDMFQPLAPYDGVRFTWPVLLLLCAAGTAALSVLWLVLSQAGAAREEAGAHEG